MDIYNTIASWAGWPAVVALMLVIGSVIYLVLNNRIEIYREKLEEAREELEEAKENSPDVIVKRLAYRHKLAVEELERLSADQESNKEIIQKRNPNWLK